MYILIYLMKMLATHLVAILNKQCIHHVLYADCIASLTLKFTDLYSLISSYRIFTNIIERHSSIMNFSYRMHFLICLNTAV